MTLRDGMGREVEGVSGWGIHVHPWPPLFVFPWILIFRRESHTVNRERKESDKETGLSLQRGQNCCLFSLWVLEKLL